MKEILQEIAASSSLEPRVLNGPATHSARSFFPVAKWCREGRWVDSGHTLINNKGCPIYTQIYRYNPIRPAAERSDAKTSSTEASLPRGATL